MAYSLSMRCVKAVPAPEVTRPTRSDVLLVRGRLCGEGGSRYPIGNPGWSHALAGKCWEVPSEEKIHNRL